MSFFPQQSGGFFGQGSFQVDPNSTPEMLARKREMIAAMMPRFGEARYVGQGIGQLATGIASGMKAKALDKFEGERRQEASAQFNNLFSGGGGGVSQQGGPLSILGVKPSTPPNPNDAKYPTGAEGPAPMGNVDPASGLSMGEAVEFDVRQGLIDRGMPPHIADAFVMNFEDESGLNPGINEISPIVPGSRGGFGLSQWTGPRRRQLEAFAQQRGVPVSDPNMQLDFLMTELQGPEAAAAKAIFAAPDTGTAAAAIVNKFLRPAEEHRARRVAKYTSGGGSAPRASAAPQSGQLNALLMAAQNPYLSPQQVAVVNSQIQQLQGQQKMAQQQQMRQSDPMYQIQLAQAQLDLEQAQNPAPGYRVLSAGEASQMGLPDGAYQIGPDGKIAKVGGGGVTVNNMPAGQPNIGTIPQGYSAIKDDTQPSGYRLIAIPGGPEDTSANDAVAKENRERSGAVVTEDIDKALGIVTNSPGWTTGLGAMLKSLPGTQAKSLDGLLQTIKANVGFDRLQQMRDASKTGGALGAINKTEMDLLQAVLGNLDQSLNADDLARNLKRVNDIYLDIIHGKGNRPDNGSDLPPGAENFGAALHQRLPEPNADGWIELNGLKIRPKR